MHEQNEHKAPWACILPIALMIGLTACGGGGGSSAGGNGDDPPTDDTVSSGYSLPSEISAVPADNGAAQSSPILAKSFSKSLNNLSKAVADLSNTSDYNTAQPRIYVEERSLEQFDVIETIFSALEQTHYADAENIGAGSYQAIISWEEDGDGGRSTKKLQTWTVNSDMVDLGGYPSDVTGDASGLTNVLHAWIPEIDDKTGQESLIKAEFKIYSSPTKAEDGSLLTFGEWDLNVIMGANPDDVDEIPGGGPDKFFAAKARVGGDGESILAVQDKFTEQFGPGQPVASGMKGILKRISAAEGYGQVEYPDWNACWGDPENNPCITDGIPKINAGYAYNDDYLAIKVDEDNDPETLDDTVYKDRNLSNAVVVTHRYGLFYATADADAGIAAGDSLDKHKNFGFPVSYQCGGTNESNQAFSFQGHGYYGAWQGRHQLWGCPAESTDTVYTREDHGANNANPATYTLKEFDGTLTMRTLVDASLNDIKNIPVETWLNTHFDIVYLSTNAPNGTGWYSCDGWINFWQLNPNNQTPDMEQLCMSKDWTGAGTLSLLDNAWFDQLVKGEADRRWIDIGGNSGDMETPGWVNYVYVKTDPGNEFDFSGGEGFYEAERSMNGNGLTPLSGQKLTPTEGKQLGINISGSIYVAYTGDFDINDDNTPDTTGWVQKKLIGFDDKTWAATFGNQPGDDIEFTPEQGHQYYMNSKGQNYVVTRISSEANSADDYSARLELQNSANPNNAASLVPTGADYLATPWDKQKRYMFDTDPNSQTYLMLVVLADDSDTSQPGDIAENAWGLMAFQDTNNNNDGDTLNKFVDDKPLTAAGEVLNVDDWGWVDPSQNDGKEPSQFNWEYVGENGFNSWGKQQFLVDADDNYVLLSDPIMLEGVALHNNAGTETGEIVNLQYDGWMHGLPDMYFELSKNDWDISGMDEFVRRLMDGQSVTDANSVEFYVRPMETSLFLKELTSEEANAASASLPDIANAALASLDDVPTYVAHNMGEVPTGSTVVVKYVEGKAVE